MADGRTKKFMKEKWEKLCQYVEWGMSNKRAAEAIGISEKTLYDWIDKGENHPTLFPEHAEFFDRFISCGAQGEAYYVEQLYKAAASDAKVAQFVLERRNADDWGKQVVVVTDWEEELQSLGLTPEEVKNVVVQVISEKIAAKQAEFDSDNAGQHETVSAEEPPDMDPPPGTTV